MGTIMACASTGPVRTVPFWVQLAVLNESTYEEGIVWNPYRGNGWNGSKSIRIGNEAISCFQGETTGHIWRQLETWTSFETKRNLT